MLSSRVGIIQRVLTDYRKPFFEKLATAPGIDLSVFAGEPVLNEGLKTAESLDKAQFWQAKNRYMSIPSGHVCWQSGIKKWLRDFSPDILITDSNPRLLSSRVALAWMKRRNRPVIAWGLGQLPRSGSAWQRYIRRQIAHKLIRKFDGVIAYSSKAARDYADIGINPDNIFVAHNAIDNYESEKYLGIFGADNSWIMPWKKKLNLHPNLPVVIFVGRLLAQKRVNLLIEACAAIFPHCQLLIVGDGPEMSNLKIHAKSHEEYIRFAGHQRGADLAKCFLAADLFVLPGLGGLAVYQAMSYGKPIIVSFGDGTEEDLLHENLNGVSFRNGDVNDLSEKIRSLLANHEQLSIMGKASLGIIRSQMSLDVMIADFCRAIKETTNYVDSKNVAE